MWPRVKPEVDNIIQSFRNSRRRLREQAYAQIPNRTDRDDKDDYRGSFDGDSATVIPESHQTSSFRDGLAPISSSLAPHQTTNNIRQRSAAGSPAVAANDRLLDADVEMVQLNQVRICFRGVSPFQLPPIWIWTDALVFSPQSRPNLPLRAFKYLPLVLSQTRAPFFTPMTPVSTRPASRSGPAEDIAANPNPWLAEAELPIPSSIPLPVSPAASLTVADPRTPPVTSSGVLSPVSINLGTPLQQAAVLSPAEPVTPHQRVSSSATTRPSHSRHQTSSQSSLNAFAPPLLGPGPSARSPAVRANSPSDMSDSVMSMISAAPSRGWTDGGTADIFSGQSQVASF